MNFRLALEVLQRHGVEHVVVGGVAVVVHGASLMTKDLDILYRLGPENVARLLAAFDELEAVAWRDPRRLRFTAAHLVNRRFGADRQVERPTARERRRQATEPSNRHHLTAASTRWLARS